MSRLTHDLRRIAQAFLAVAFALLGLACAAQAQFTRRQFATAMSGAYAVEVDTALLARTAAEAGVGVPARTLAVYVAPGYGFACGEGRCSGIWIQTSAGDYIIVAEARMLQEPWLLRHEYLHHVLQTGDHPPTFRRLGLPTEDR